MRALHIANFGGPAEVVLVDIDEPGAISGHVLIDVHIAGVSFPELLQTKGMYQMKPELPYVPGSEVAGVVRSAPESSEFAPGDRVMAFSMLGGFAETVAVAEHFVLPLPDSVSFEVGAAAGMNYLTMQFGLVRRGQLQAGETVLVHGAGGGIGTATIQLAQAFGAQVIGVASSPDKADAARAAGATRVVPTEGFKDTVLDLTNGRGVDMVVDPVGGDLFTDSLRCLSQEGRLLVVGFAGGEIPTVRVNRLLLNNISAVGVGLGAFLAPNPDYTRALWDEITPLFEDGQLRPVVAETLPLERAADALVALDERRVNGKVLLAVR